MRKRKKSEMSFGLAPVKQEGTKYNNWELVHVKEDRYPFTGVKDKRRIAMLLEYCDKRTYDSMMQASEIKILKEENEKLSIRAARYERIIDNLQNIKE